MNEQELLACADAHFHSRYTGETVAKAREFMDCGTNDPVAQLVADRIESAVADVEPEDRTDSLAEDLLDAAKGILRIAAGFEEAAAS